MRRLWNATRARAYSILSLAVKLAGAPLRDYGFLRDLYPSLSPFVLNGSQCATFVLLASSTVMGEHFTVGELLRRKRALSDALSLNTKAHSLSVSKITKMGLIGFYDALDGASPLPKWIAIVVSLNRTKAHPHFVDY